MGNAFPAGDAIRVYYWLIAEGGDLAGVATVDYSDSTYPHNLITYPHALPAKDALIQIAVEEGITIVNWKRPIRPAEGQLGNAQVVNDFLQLTVPILGTGYAALGYCHITQADVKRLAPLFSIAYQAFAGVVSQEQADGDTAHLIYRWRIGVHYHTIGSRRGTGGGQTAHLLNLHDTKAAAPIRFQVRVSAKNGDIDASRLGCLKHGHPLPGSYLLTING
jgi:hypothetical protein